jgi:predicted acyl esterase
VPNRSYETLHASLFTSAAHPQPALTILFMHGYGSNRLECASLLRALPEEWAVCAFDFSGSGKSEGDLVTYGAKEKEDIGTWRWT